MSLYSDDFYAGLAAGTRTSAQAIVPFVLRLVQPRSVVDVGCGLGTWLAVFRAQGIEDVVGLDGDWVDPARLEIPADRFRTVDLARPLRLARRFDLALSLEVAEHLPAGSADDFVHALTALADVVLFSAAIPFQGGYGHINEQWPAYWARRFGAHDYVAVDVVRQAFWENDDVYWWYAQNTLLYVHAAQLHRYPLLHQHVRHSDALQGMLPETARAAAPMPLVHPKKYLSCVQT